MTREKTRRPNPARYLSGISIRTLQIETIKSPSVIAKATPPSKTKYLKKMRQVIGWDDGQDASWSYVECSGSAVRFFHGRPMHASNSMAVTQP